MRSILFALAAVTALTASASAQQFPVPVGPGSTIASVFPLPGGFTTFVINRADGSHAIITTGPRGGVRRYIVVDNPPVPRGGYSYELNGRTIVVPPNPNLRPFNQVDPKAMERLSSYRAEPVTDRVLGGLGSHGGGDR